MRLALAQISVVYSDIQHNLSRVLDSIDYGAKQKANVVIFPECCDIGWANPNAAYLAEGLSGDFINRIREKAKEKSMHVLIGINESIDDRIYNSAVLVDKEGKISQKYHKINELGFAKAIYSTGNKITSFDIEGIKVGINICADNWVSDIVDQYSKFGVNLIFSLCAWAVDKGKEKGNLAKIKGWLTERTMNRDITIVCVNCVGQVGEGEWKGKILQGNSLIMGPYGRLILEMGQKEYTKVIDLNV